MVHDAVGGAQRVAAYRVFAGADALPFDDGVALVWRVGDAAAPVSMT
jgi:hypothetical protein